VQDAGTAGRSERTARSRTPARLPAEVKVKIGQQRISLATLKPSDAFGSLFLASLEHHS
jgi:hypothetical protein